MEAEVYNIEPLADLPNLETLSLYNSDLGYLPDMRGLQALNLYGTGISDISLLADVPRLRTLNRKRCFRL